MANGRKVGDWQHRDHETANTILKDPNAKKWYEQTFWIVFFLVVFWPAGLFMMWRSDWHVAVKVVVTIVLAGVIFMWWSMTQAAMSASA